MYLASPLGFSPAGHDFMIRLVGSLRTTGIEVLNPWDLPIATVKEWQRQHGQKRANWLIGKHNAELIKQADAVFAVLDGVDVDSGTASEIGYASALGKLVVGYRGDWRLTGDNAAARVNLQVEYFIAASGGGTFAAIDYLDREGPGQQALEDAIALLAKGGEQEDGAD